MKKHPRIIILGAGPCGLGAAWRLHEMGYTNFHVYEACAVPGGLARSFLDKQGFTWDIGGHVLHSHYPYFDRVFQTVMDGHYVTHERESWIWLKDRYIPYPFQNNIHRLPDVIRDFCFVELQKVKKSLSTKKPVNFAEWIIASYGIGIAEIFLLPYNRKVWAYPLENMSTVWVGDRVAPVDVARIQENIRTNHDDIGWGPNAVFHFPLHGGTGDIWSRVARNYLSRISYNTIITRIDAQKKKIYTKDGSVISYDVLLSTLPLTSLIANIYGMYQRPDVSKLHASSVTVVGMGIKGTPPTNLAHKCWIYYPELAIPFFRATIFSHYSPHNAPPGHWSIMVEVASSLYSPLPDGNIIDACIAGAKQATLIKESDKIVNTFCYTARFGYPTPTRDRDFLVDPAIALLEHYHIYSRGRFGLWKYEISNQDHVFMQGVEWVNKMLN